MVVKRTLHGPTCCDLPITPVLPQLLHNKQLENRLRKQALGLKMRQICFVEKETFLADQHTAAKLLKVTSLVAVSHKTCEVDAQLSMCLRSCFSPGVLAQ